MKKEVKIILYCTLGIILILVLCLVIGGRKHNAGEPDVNPNIEPGIVGQEIGVETGESNTQEEEMLPGNSEQEILNDLESLFKNTNGYENVEGDFGFINTEN